MQDNRQKRLTLSARKSFAPQKLVGPAVLMNDLAGYIENNIGYYTELSEIPENQYFQQYRPAAGQGCKPTAFYEALRNLYKNLRFAVSDGKVALHCVMTYEKPPLANLDIPTEPQGLNLSGLILSERAVKDLIKEELYHVKEKDDKEAFEGLEQLLVFFNRAFKALPDYSGADIELVNAPVDPSKVKNSYSARMDEYRRLQQIEAERRKFAAMEEERRKRERENLQKKPKEELSPKERLERDITEAQKKIAQRLR